MCPSASRLRSKVMAPFGEGAGLVGEEDLDAAEILDCHQPLHQHLLRGEGFEPAERLTVTMAGIISGAMPTAMASEKSRASIRGRDSATLTMKMNAVRTAATSNRKRENRANPTSKAVRPCVSARPAAICPNAVRAPVRTTTPRPTPG